jgi:hypothetical protein
MKPIRILIAGVLGGVIMFCWGAVSHVILPIGEMSLRETPNDPALMTAMKENFKEHAAYMLPPMNLKDESEAGYTAMGDAYRVGPRGMVFYDPTGGEMMGPGQLGTEFASNVLAALLGAIVLSCARAGFVCRVLLATLIGVAAWVSIDVSYWNWYRFPTGFALGSLIDQAAGWFLAGLGMAAVLPRNPTPAPTAP